MTSTVYVEVLTLTRDHGAHTGLRVSIRGFRGIIGRTLFGWFRTMLMIFRGSGFLKYWTISNLPLFILATPMLLILLRSGIWALQGCLNSNVSTGKGMRKNIKVSPSLRINQGIARRLATPQILIAALALTSHHVQIITRLSSGYPVWYWWLASCILEDRKTSFMGRKWSTAFIISRWMVIYAIVQGGLFASFLPPA